MLPSNTFVDISTWSHAAAYVFVSGVAGTSVGLTRCDTLTVFAAIVIFADVVFTAVVSVTCVAFHAGTFVTAPSVGAVSIFVTFMRLLDTFVGILADKAITAEACT